MSMRINTNHPVTHRPITEQKPGGPSVPPSSVQVPVPSSPVGGVHGTSFKAQTEGLNLQGGVAQGGMDIVQRQLAVNTVYSQLMEDAVTARAINSLRVRDGAALAALGNLMASGKLPLWPEKQAALDKLRQSQPEVFTQLITLAQQLGTDAALPARATPDAAATQAVGALGAASAALTQARDVVAGLDQQLASALGTLGPALSAEQQRAFIDAFHGANQAAYDQASRAEAELAATLLNPALDKAVSQNLNLAYEVADAAQRLAGGNHSVEVMQWASRVLDEANAAQDVFEQTQAGVSIPGWTGAGPSELRAPIDFNELRSQALAGAAGQLLAQANGDSAAALANFSAMASALGGDAAKTNEMLSALNKASAGDYSGVSSMLASADPTLQGLGRAATVFAGLNAVNPAQQAAYGKFLQDRVAQGADGAKALSSALRSLAGASTAAAAGSPVDARIAASVGALSTALNGTADPMDLFNTSSFEDGARALNDLSLLASGDAPALAPEPNAVTEAVTELITDLGEEIVESMRSDALEASKKSEADRAENDRVEKDEEAAEEEEAQELLEKAGVERTLARVLAKSADLPRALRSKVGLTPAQIASLAVSHPDLFAGAKAAQDAVEFARVSGVVGDTARRFLDSLAKEDPNYLAKLSARNQEELRAFGEQWFPRTTALARELAAS